jgi:hypothetical protein
MSIKNVFSQVELIKAAIQENVQAEKDLDAYNDEHWDVFEEQGRLEKRTEDTEAKADNLLSGFKTVFRDLKNITPVEKDIDWLSLPLIVGRNFYNREDVERYKDIILSDDFYCCTNGKMIFYIPNDIEVENTVKCAESQMQCFKDFYTEEYITFETFDISKVEDAAYDSVKYTTDSGTEIFFTPELLGACVMIGSEITIHYSRTKPELPIYFTCGNRRAALMPKRKPE